MKKGTCLKCGCTEEKPCWHPDGARPCGWIDDQQDFCDRCAGLLLELPIEPVDLAESTLVIRTLRALLIATLSRHDRFERLLFQLAQEAGGQPLAGAENCGRIEIEIPAFWTPLGTRD